MMVYKHAVMESRVKIDLPRFLKSLKQLSDFDFFTAKSTFKFVEVRTPKSTAIALLDAIRYKACAESWVDSWSPGCILVPRSSRSERRRHLPSGRCLIL
jgi:hypothetical protein